MLPYNPLVTNKGNAQRASKTITFDGCCGNGAVGTVDLFTVTGQVLLLVIGPFCNTNLTEAACNATLQLGVENNTTLFIAATTALDIDANEFWVDTTPDSDGVALPAALKDILVNSNIQAEVAVADIDGGEIEFNIWWMPLSPDGNVEPA